MKSIKEKANEVFDDPFKQECFEAGANYVLDAITECLPKTMSCNPNEVIDIIANRIKELKK